MWAATATYATALTVLGTWRFEIYRAGVDDGIFTQVIASSLHGFRSTIEGNENHLAVHFSPILFAVAPILALTRSTLGLVALQALALALVAPPIYAIARRRMPDTLAAGVALVALLYPPLTGIAFTDFHEACFIPAAIVWMLDAIDRRSWPTAVACALCALASKEDAAVLLAWIGLVGALDGLRRHDRASTLGFASIGCLAAACFALYFGVVRTWAHPLAPYWSFHFYDWHYAVPGTQGIAAADSPLRLLYVRGALLPLVGISLLSPAIVLALPGFVETLASHESITLALGTHYPALWVGPMLVAYALGVAVLERRSSRLAALGLSLSFAVSAYVDVYASPSSWHYYLYRKPDARDRLVTNVLGTLPPDARVATTLEMFAHLGFDPNATIDPGRADTLVVDRRCDTGDCRSGFIPEVDALVARNEFVLSKDVDGVDVYVRARAPRR